MANIRPDQLTGLSPMGDNDIFIIQTNVTASNVADRTVGKITKSQLGFAKQSDLSSYVTSANLSSTLSSYVTSSSLSSTLGSYVSSTSLSSTLTNYVLRSETGGFGGGGSFNDSHLYPRSNPSGFVTHSETGGLGGGSFDDAHLYPRTNPSGFITSSQTGGFGGGSFDDAHLYPRTNPSGFITSSQTGGFGGGSFDDAHLYPRTNPSGFITSSQTGGFGGGGASETSFAVVNGGGVYAINNNSDYNSNSNVNPTLYLHRGLDYKFNVNAAGHPFRINTVNNIGTSNAYSVGVTNNGTDNGTVSFKIPQDAPSTLYYNCQYHAGMSGQLNILDLTNTSNFVEKSETGSFLTSDNDSAYYPRTNPSGFITSAETGSFLTLDDDSAHYPRTNPSGFITSAETGAFGGKWLDGVSAGQIHYSAGNVGVGTSSPKQSLDVAGNVILGKDAFDDSHQIIGRTDVSGDILHRSGDYINFGGIVSGQSGVFDWVSGNSGYLKDELTVGTGNFDLAVFKDTTEGGVRDQSITFNTSYLYLNQLPSTGGLPHHLVLDSNNRVHVNTGENNCCDDFQPFSWFLM